MSQSLHRRLAAGEMADGTMSHGHSQCHNNVGGRTYLPWRGRRIATIVPAVTPEQGHELPPNRPDRDDGGPNPLLVAALTAHRNGNGGPADVVAALASSRLLIPVLAVDAQSHLSSVTTTDSSGHSGMLAFTCVDAMRRWDSRARPVPIPTRSAAEAALANGAERLIIDVAGPAEFAVEVSHLRSLAAGWRPVDAWLGATASTPSASSDDQDVPTTPLAEAPSRNGTTRHGVKSLMDRALAAVRRKP